MNSNLKSQNKKTIFVTTTDVQRKWGNIRKELDSGSKVWVVHNSEPMYEINLIDKGENEFVEILSQEYSRELEKVIEEFEKEDAAGKLKPMSAKELIDSLHNHVDDDNDDLSDKV